MKFVKYIYAFIMLLVVQQATGQEILDRITANLNKTGDDTFRLVFRIDQASTGTGNPLNVLLKVPDVVIGDMSFQLTSNPFGLALSGPPNPLGGALYFQYQSQQLIDLSSWEVGETITIATFKVNGSANSVVLSGGEFGNSPFGTFWPGTSLSLGRDNLVRWPIFSTVNLPVELTYFSAEAQSDQTSMLKWETATELNNDRFEVEHSMDGITFKGIGKVKGAGTTDQVQYYDFLHRTPETGTNYYRLKQVDHDGAFAYSPIEAVNFDREASSNQSGFIAFPNPAINYVMIRNSGKVEKPWNVDVIDIQGRIIKSFIMQDDTYRLDTGDLPAGVYHIRLRSNDRIEQIRFVKE